MKKALLATALLLATTANAVPIDSVSALLQGDPRDDNPEGIALSVQGTQDGANEDIFDFVIDFTALMDSTHPNAKLLEFYFNVNPDDAAQWVVSDVTAGWDWVTPATVQGGGNNSGFLFELTDTQQPTPIPLEFTLQYLGGDITSDNFALAPDWVSNNEELTEAQLGAHVGGLTVNATTCPSGTCDNFGTADGGSGFAVADWGVPSGDPRQNAIDSPGVLALLSMGLLGLFYSRKQRYDKSDI